MFKRKKKKANLKAKVLSYILENNGVMLISSFFIIQFFVLYKVIVNFVTISKEKEKTPLQNQNAKLKKELHNKNDDEFLENFVIKIFDYVLKKM
tara:strand:+ start:207 stop:488 length:282 start_codon:yes stop_codon:yes gene_type:complete